MARISGFFQRCALAACLLLCILATSMISGSQASPIPWEDDRPVYLFRIADDSPFRSDRLFKRAAASAMKREKIIMDSLGGDYLVR
ncbi:hypothetical protein M3Y99_01326700 [Aphelenchoides fujianensis]|nr:hypothetical protein M3Y99_01326700 [Aphelenchoides fujianensis]